MRDGSPYAAFQILKDGLWHSASELKSRCGRNGDRRARELRDGRFGSLNVETRRGKDTEYRIAPDEFVRKTDVIAALNDRRLPRRVDIVDRTSTLSLTNSEIILLISALENRDCMQHDQVRALWDQARDRIIRRLYCRLPDSLVSPYDLFEEDHP